MNQSLLKQQAAEAALAYIPENAIVGVGTGSTVNYFIEALATIKGRIEGTVASSTITANLLRKLGIPVLDLNSIDHLPIYVDGADEINRHLQMIKGGGGALTREKIIAAVAEHFICIADESKKTKSLGKFPLPVEVIPMARSYVGREIVKLGGDPCYRSGFLTDNGNIIIDIHHLTIEEPIALEERINNITGVVAHGLFAARPADSLLLATSKGVECHKASHN